MPSWIHLEGGQILRPLAIERHLFKGFNRVLIGFWMVFYVENLRFALDTLRVANRSPTPASKINDLLGWFEDSWGVRGRLSWPIWGDSGGPGRNQKYIIV